MSKTRSDLDSRIADLLDQGRSYREIAGALDTTVWQVRRVQAATGAGSSTPTRARHSQTPQALDEDPDNPILRSAVVRELRKGWRNLDHLSERLGISNTAALSSIISHMSDRGYNVIWDGPRARIAAEGMAGTHDGRAHLLGPDAHPISDNWHRFGIVSDTHLCNKHCRLDVLEAAYDHFRNQGIRTVLHAGNIVDGESNYNTYELLAHGVHDQAMYVLDHYPRRPSITTYYISGKCHEGWWQSKTGLDFGRYLELEAADAGRSDLRYLGYMEADLLLPTVNSNSATIRLFHPSGGIAYALSYAPQKIIESLEGGGKPGLMIVGHYHKYLTLDIRNVWCLLPGCTEDQTPFMRSKHIEARVGFCTLSLQMDDNGAIRRLSHEWTSYFNRSYHQSHTLQ